MQLGVEEGVVLPGDGGALGGRLELLDQVLGGGLLPRGDHVGGELVQVVHVVRVRCDLVWKKIQRVGVSVT